jgi:hypothetical protein
MHVTLKQEARHVATLTPLIASSKISARDFRDAKRAWSQRLLLIPEAAAVVHGAVRRAGAHAVAASTRARSARRNPNVVGVGIAEKLVKGKPTGVLAVKFFVKTKYPTGAVARGMALPKNIDGLPVDVEETGTFQAFARRKRRGGAADATLPNPRVHMRPAVPGSSIGFRIAGDRFVMCGTFGALVKTSRKVYILSNNHVLADENRLPIGSPIFQPGLMDDGDVNADQIAELSRFIKLRANRYNKVDAALAEPLRRNLVGKDMLHIGAPSGTVQAEIDMVVHKFGRTTSYTTGRIVSIDTDVSVEYETAELTFESQIIIHGSSGQMFSDSGDSGSVVLQRGTNVAVGLLFGGSPNHTIANPIGNVLRSLRVRMA